MIWLRRGLLALTSAVALAGCEQGVGDRCQVNADCKGTLVCNITTQRCAQRAGGQPVPDAMPADAMVPLEPDAMVEPPADAMDASDAMDAMDASDAMPDAMAADEPT